MLNVRWRLGVVGLVWGCASAQANQQTPLLLKGQELFERVWTANDPRSADGDGLGPMFNADSCATCHTLGGPGGAGGAEHNVLLLGDRLFHHQSIDAAYSEWHDTLINTAPLAGGLVFLPNASAIPPHFHAQMLSQASIDTPTSGKNRNTNAPVALRGGIQSSFQSSHRNTPALWGAGLIDQIPESAIIAHAQRADAPIPGRLGTTADGGMIGRFGWKGDVESLPAFVRQACGNELGLEVPGAHQAPLFDTGRPPTEAITALSKGNIDEIQIKQSGPIRNAKPSAVGLDLREEDLEAMIAYVAALPRPPQPMLTEEPSLLGQAVFEEMGCADCHTPNLGGVEGLYSDLLLHDMGPELSGRGGSYGGALQVAINNEMDAAPPRAAEWRTPPLWGVADTAPYLHDGRAQTLAQAIALHGGQAEPARVAWRAAAPEELDALYAFLGTLRSPYAAVTEEQLSPFPTRR